MHAQRWVRHLLPAALAVASAWFLVAFSRFLLTESEARLAVGLALVLLVVAMGLAFLFRVARRDWFHPLVFPVFYMAVVFVAPVLWILGTGRSLGNTDPREVSAKLLVVFLVTVGAFAVGALRAQRPPVAEGPPKPINYVRMRRIGRFLLGLTLLSLLERLSGVLAIPYGSDQINYGPGGWRTTAEGGLIFLAVILIAVANTQLHRKVFRRLDVVLLMLFTMATFASGSRGELLAPFLFAVWARHAYVRPLRLRQAIPVLFLVILLFQSVALYRPQYDVGAPTTLQREPEYLVEGTLLHIGTPVQITGTVVRAVPRGHPFEHGRTYLAALVRQLPGPLSRALLGPPTDTGTYVYRDIVGLTDPSIGYGFALPAEAYLNLGMPGVAGIGLLVGLLFGFAYRRRARSPSRAVHFLYPILIAVLPLGLRSDAVFQIKLVLYPMIALAIMYRLCRVPHRYLHHRPGRVAPVRPVRPDRLAERGVEPLRPLADR